MSADTRERRLRWAIVAAAVGLGVALVVGVGLLVRSMVFGETLASGDGWRIQAKWSPFGSNVTYHDDERSGGAGGLASPGRLSEAITYVPPDESATYLVGVVPEGAATVTTAAGVESSTELHGFLDAFYVVRIDGVPAEVRLEAVDADGRVVDTAEPPPFARQPEPEPEGERLLGTVEAMTGSAHCGWESVEILRVSTDIAPPQSPGDAWVDFVRDTEGVLPDRLVSGSFEAQVALPDRAFDLGHETPYGQIWLSLDDADAAYVVVDIGTVERWPAGNPGCD